MSLLWGAAEFTLCLGKPLTSVNYILKFQQNSSHNRLGGVLKRNYTFRDGPANRRTDKRRVKHSFALSLKNAGTLNITTNKVPIFYIPMLHMCWSCFIYTRNWMTDRFNFEIFQVFTCEIWFYIANKNGLEFWTLRLVPLNST